jgi:tRNA pseudouridine55 synthase
VRLSGDGARRATHGVAGASGQPAASGAAHVRLTDAEGVIAIAEPRAGEDGIALLKPVVGLRG